jgi:HlyD family secretion protein
MTDGRTTPATFSARVRALAKAVWTRLRTIGRGARDELVGAAPALRRENAFLREFKPDDVAIEERPVPVSIHATLYTALAILVVAIVWAFVGTMDRIVVAQGKVSTSPPLIVLQPFAVARILAIPVTAGDHVKKGDVLISFDPAFARADESSLVGQVNELNAIRERMEAEMTGIPFVAGENAAPGRSTQEEIYARRQAQFASELAGHETNVKRLSQERDATRTAVTRLERERELARKVTAMRQELLDRKVGSELQLVVAQKDQLNVEQRLDAAISQGQSLAQQQLQAEAERDAYLANWRRQLSEDLVTVRQHAKEASDNLSKAQRLREFTSLTAPVDGIVLEIADRSVGSVLREAETAVTLVPGDAALEVDADILSKDVGYVSVGDPVRVKLEAYPFQKFGTVDGALTVVSPDSIVRQVGQSSITVFHAKVHLKATVEELAARSIRLRPGLIATAEITTGHRSIASYLLYPIFRVFDEGLKEP